MVKPCEICGGRVSRYICQECGRAICESCIKPDTWLCLDCYRRAGKIAPQEVELEESVPQFPSALKLFFIGFMLIFLGVIVLMLVAIFSGLTKSSGLILLLGPIPIIFGVGENLTLLLVIAAMLTVFYIAILIIFNRRITKP
ncbi:MAG: DUF131 domain-containing protein [Candidatus Bathyarchaeia archaeon]